MSDKPMPGGTGPAKEVDSEAKAVIVGVRPKVEAHLGKNFAQFEPEAMRTQVVAGVNYFAKVRVAPEEYVHLRIYRHFSGETHLHGVQEGKKKEDPLDYFEQNIQP